MAGALLGAGCQDENCTADNSIPLNKSDLRQSSMSVVGDKVIIKFIPSTVFGGSWKTGGNREINEKELQKYIWLANKNGVGVGEKLDVKLEGKFLVWTLERIAPPNVQKIGNKTIIHKGVMPNKSVTIEDDD